MNHDQGMQPSPKVMEQFYSLIKTRLRITANVIADEGIRVGSDFNKLLV